MKFLIKKENDLNVGVINAFILCTPVYSLLALVIYLVKYV